MGIYVASRASLPARGAMWRSLRAQGWPISASWIDEDGEGQTTDFVELWSRIEREVTGATGLVLYAETEDLPLKGALIEVGMALAARVPVFAVLPGIEMAPRSMRPVGSWLRHPRVKIMPTVEEALREAGPAPEWPGEDWEEHCGDPACEACHGDIPEERVRAFQTWQVYHTTQPG